MTGLDRIASAAVWGLLTHAPFDLPRPLPYLSFVKTSFLESENIMNAKDQKRSGSNEWCISKSVLADGELNGSVIFLGPGCETSAEETAVDRVIYVAQGTVTTSTELANTILNTDQTLHVAEGRSLTVRNQGETPAKFFSLALPAKRREEPLLVFPR